MHINLNHQTKKMFDSYTTCYDLQKALDECNLELHSHIKKGLVGAYTQSHFVPIFNNVYDCNLKSSFKLMTPKNKIFPIEQNETAMFSFFGITAGQLTTGDVINEPQIYCSKQKWM